MRTAAYAEDRTLAVPPGSVVVTGYVSVFSVRHACRDRMDAAAIERAYRQLLQLAGAQPHPAPFGEWQGDTFVLHDGRHQHLAAIAVGYSHLLVSWIEPARATDPSLSTAPGTKGTPDC